MGQNPSFVANGDINPRRFVMMAADFRVAQATANAAIIGVSQNFSRLYNDPLCAKAGENCPTYGLGDVCEIVAGAAIAVGDRLKSDANGKAIKADAAALTLQNLGGVALQAASAADEVIRIQIINATYNNGIA